MEATTTSAVDPFGFRGRPDHGAAAARAADIFERHGAMVLGLCRMLLRNRHEAEDVAQQTFLSAYRSLLNGSEPRHPAAWLATIARNECRTTIERRMREPLRDADELESPLPDPVAQAAARADLAELWRAIGQLPRQQRRALLLREFWGLSYDELAAELAVTEPAVESLLFRARREVRRRIRPVSGSAAAITAPLGLLRDVVARMLAGTGQPATAGLAKVAAGATAVVVAGGTVAAVETHTLRPEIGTPKADAAIVQRAHPPAARPEHVARPTHPRAVRIGNTVRAVHTTRAGAPTVRPVAAASHHAPTPAPAAPRPVPAAPRRTDPAAPVAAPAVTAPAPAPAQAGATTPLPEAGTDPTAADSSGPGDGGGASTPDDSSGPGPGSGDDSGSGGSSGPGDDSGSGSGGSGGDGNSGSDGGDDHGGHGGGGGGDDPGGGHGRG